MKTPVLDSITTTREKKELLDLMGSDQLIEIKESYASGEDLLVLDAIRASRRLIQQRVTDSQGHDFLVNTIHFDHLHPLKSSDRDQHKYLAVWDSEWGRFIWLRPDTVAELTSVDVAMNYLLKDF